MKKVIKVIGIILLILIILMAIAGIGGYAYIRNKLGKLQYEEISQDATELGISDQSQEKTSQMKKECRLRLRIWSTDTSQQANR